MVVGGQAEIVDLSLGMVLFWGDSTREFCSVTTETPVFEKAALVGFVVGGFGAWQRMIVNRAFLLLHVRFVTIDRG